MPESCRNSAAAYAQYGAIITSDVSTCAWRSSTALPLTPRKNAAASTANAAPVAVLPETRGKYPTLSKTRTTLEAEAPLSAKSSNVRYSTMATASFNTDSPNTSANKSGLTPSSWNTASTDTGSVAETSAPNTSACVMDSAVTSPIAPHTQQNTPTTIVEMSVPPNASAQIPSKFRKKLLVSSEKPLSKMMGGSNRKKKISSLKSTFCVSLCVASADHITSPTKMPSSSVAPASGM